jgi:hypothetical protein
MDMIRISADEEKPALELTPDIIQAVKSDSAISHTSVDEAKKTFIEQARALKPSVDKELLDELWDKYTQSLKNLPRTIHETFPDFETWFNENKYNLVNWFNEHFQTPRNPDPFQKTTSESGVDAETYIKENIAPGMYQKSLALDRFKQIGISPAKETNNPLVAFNSLMDSYSRGLANHFTQKLDDIPTSENKTITFITGNPGAGKSTLIEFDNSDDNPIRQTKFGTLIDPDEFQPLLPGYAAGARSQDVLIYAKQLVAKRLQTEAMNRGLDIAIPLVGGQANILAKDIAEALLKGYNVKVIHKALSKDESQLRSINRAEQGGRLITPNTGATDPAAAFQDLQDNPEQIKNKIISILKDQIKEEKKQGNIVTTLPNDEEINNLLAKVEFTNIDEIVTSSVTFARKLIRIAKQLEKINKYKYSDKLMNLSLSLITHNSREN